MDNLKRRILARGEAQSDMKYVDLGLPSGNLWASGNIVKNATTGRYSIGDETDYGCYFSWGNVDGHNQGEGYNFNTSTYSSTPGYSISADITPNSGDDSARETVGGNWQTPSKEDWEELKSNCTQAWIAQNGIAGVRFTSNIEGFTDRSIFLPASGYYNGTVLTIRNSDCRYWTSTWYSSSQGYGFNNSSTSSNVSAAGKEYGRTVRPVQPIMQRITLTFTTTDNTSNVNVEITLVDRYGSVYTSTTDANGQITKKVAVGPVNVFARGYGLLSSKIIVARGISSYSVKGIVCGVYAYYQDGTMRGEDTADSNAIGVAVVTENASFVVTNDSGISNAYQRTHYRFDPRIELDMVQAKTESDAKNDFAGEHNTTELITKYHSTSSDMAVQYARNKANGKGYLGSAGEWNELIKNKSAFNAMRAAIGKGSIYDTSIWTSTIYNYEQGWMVKNMTTFQTARANTYGSVVTFQALNPL